MGGDATFILLPSLEYLPPCLLCSSIISLIFKILVERHPLQVPPSHNYSLFLVYSKMHIPSATSDLLHSSTFPQDGQLTGDISSSPLYHIYHHLPQCPADGICSRVTKSKPTSSFTLSHQQAGCLNLLSQCLAKLKMEELWRNPRESRDQCEFRLHDSCPYHILL